MRKRIFEVIEVAKEGDILSAVYDSFMMLVITLSLLPLVFKESTPFLTALDKTAAGIFIADYLLRWSTADLKFHSRSVNSFLRYPFSFMAIVDLLSILPSLTFLNSGFKVLRLLRMSRAFRVLRVFRALRYSRSLRIIGNVLRSSKDSLAAVGTLAIGYIFISSLIIFNAEPDSFNNFFEAMYWATVSLTTVGYGDIYPITPLGKAFGILITFLGVGMVAIPTGIISAGFVEQYSHVKRISDYAKEENLHFVKIELSPGDSWSGQMIKDLHLPHGIIVAAIQRGSEVIVPRGDVTLRTGDKLVLGAEALKGDHPVNLKEITLMKNHDWNDTAIKDLDI